VSARLIQLVFNVGVIIGLFAMTAGAAIAFGAGPALLLFGLVVWVTTIISTRTAIAMRRELGLPREDAP
jgi:hypothetical protein